MALPPAAKAAAAVRERLLAALTAHDLPGDAQGFDVLPHLEGRLRAMRAKTTPAGIGSVEFHVSFNDDGAILPQSEPRLEREIARHVRRLLRRRAIASAGANGEPAWSYTMHRLMLGMLRHAGIDPATTTIGSMAERRMLLDYMMQGTGLSMGALIVEDGRVDAATLHLDGFQYVGNGRTAAIVNAAIPESTVTSLVGRRLHQVIDHPAVARVGPIRIEEADLDGDHLTLVLEDVQDHVRRPPAGIDRSWRRIAYRPWWGD